MQTLFVWDFDNTIVLQDTDRAAVEMLQPDMLESHLNNRQLVKQIGWTQVINLSLTELAHRRFTPTDILQAVSTCHFPAATLEALRAIGSHPQARSAIISDSNSEFIGACLKAHDANDLFSAGILTNLANLHDDKIIQVVPYTVAHDAPHTCPSCPSNLCKGTALNRLTSGSPHPSRIVYVGDGANDFCAARQLQKNDVVLFRKGFSLQRRIEKSPASLLATAIGWDTPEELKQLVSQFLIESSQTGL